MPQRQLRRLQSAFSSCNSLCRPWKKQRRCFRLDHGEDRGNGDNHDSDNDDGGDENVDVHLDVLREDPLQVEEDLDGRYASQQWSPWSMTVTSKPTCYCCYFSHCCFCRQNLQNHHFCHHHCDLHHLDHHPCVWNSEVVFVTIFSVSIFKTFSINDDSVL